MIKERVSLTNIYKNQKLHAHYETKDNKNFEVFDDTDWDIKKIATVCSEDSADKLIEEYFEW